MLTTKNWLGCAAGLTLALCLAGCTPAGPKALLDGERLIEAELYSEAIARLKKATRLLPAHPQAWNHLGLAYHHAGDAEAAQKAYEEARRLDLNLTPVRYNLGCLFLEQNNLPAAVAELTAFTLLQSDSPEGWLKLGTAQLRSRQFDQAERSFQAVLRLKPDSAEAWNSLGVIQTQRRRPKEALNCFSLALQRQADYAPALLNLAVLQHQHLHNRPLALQRYQEYLELNPAAPEAASVQELMRRLQADLAAQSRREPPPVASAQAQAVVPRPRPSTSTPSTAPTTRPEGQSTASPPRPPSQVITNEVAIVPAPGPELSQSTPADQPKPKPAETPPPVTRAPAPEPKPAPATARTNLVAAADRPMPAPSPPPDSAPEQVEVVEVPDEKPPQIAHDPPAIVRTDNPSAETTRGEAALPQPVVTELPEEQARVSRENPPDDRRRPLDRLNPSTWFRSARRAPAEPTPLEAQREAARPAGAGVESERDQVVRTQPAVTGGPYGRRYAYKGAGKPAAGDRGRAQRLFAEGVQAHRERRLEKARELYRQAIRLDPSFYEAHYNLGLAAYNSKEMAESLSAYETALSINPTSLDGRYNFAVALEEGGYYQDAALELEKVLEQYPNEARAHLSLASLYAERLGRPDLARRYYRRVLELEPQHRQAAAIRYWLAANP